MKRPPDGLGPIVGVDRRRALPLHRQIYDGYRQAILDGRLRPGQRLPSTRTLADELDVSRVPVVAAFEQLAAEGWIESKVGAGSRVSAVIEAASATASKAADVARGRGKPPPRPAPGPRPLPPRLTTEARGPWLDLRGPFRMGEPAIDAFPTALFTRLVARHARKMSRREMMYGDPAGYAPLRDALAAYLRTARSVACTPAQIIVVSGSQEGLAVAARSVIAPGQEVWLEEPGYAGARDALRLAGARVASVPVDGEGLDVDAAAAMCPGARAAYVTPSHQYPLGVVMSAARRARLLDWARRNGTWILEDDYDSEYRFDTQPLPSLQGLDGDARVLYVGTFSKVLFPALRVGYLVVPEDLVDRVLRLRHATDLFPPTLYQSVLAEMLREGHFTRHLRRMRRVYEERRRCLERAIAKELGEESRVVGDRAGIHLVVLLPPGVRDRDVAVAAARRGVSAMPLSSCYSGRRAQSGLVLGYGATRPRDIPEAVRQLAAAMRDAARGRTLA